MLSSCFPHGHDIDAVVESDTSMYFYRTACNGASGWLSYALFVDGQFATTLHLSHCFGVCIDPLRGATEVFTLQLNCWQTLYKLTLVQTYAQDYDIANLRRWYGRWISTNHTRTLCVDFNPSTPRQVWRDNFVKHEISLIHVPKWRGGGGGRGEGVNSCFACRSGETVDHASSEGRGSVCISAISGGQSLFPKLPSVTQFFFSILSGG